MKTLLSPNSFKYVSTNEGGKLYSYTMQLDPCDPFVFYQRTHSSFNGQRFYWRSSDDTTIIVGIGISVSITSKSPETRFEDIQQQWRDLLNNADIHNDYEIAGIGPLLFGGFSFDTKQPASEEWENYGDSLFYLPKIMITCVQEQYFLTINSFEKLETGLRDEWKNRIKQMKPQDFSLPAVNNRKEYNIAEWLQSVEKIVKELQTTEMQKVVLARKMKLDLADSVASEPLIHSLLSQQPTSFVFSMEAGDSCFLGASPERLIKIEDDQVLSTCLAGSTGRGKDEIEDQRLGNSLLKDSKNLFEHELVVSMIEDALRPYCENLAIPKEPVLMKTPYIQHLFTPVKGKAKRNSSILKMVQALHPTPAMGGVPTKAALKIIREEEKMDRGFYASPIGWTDYRGNGEFIVGIRSGLVKGNTAYLYAGCGLVPESISKKELLETRIKFQPMLRAFGKEIL
ncbi:isochorismate synthase [Lederbergia sp. NSJ-179]|uniref:isochorismate synthase n=1 Tax=Lederbergia sp. NSJ-179 TaxID=2931402 RepID=UPI001FD5A445|nr:isochorismate synthase [Lederbergia sp. NSJ-179]MCJ7842708.1 isochorismate synthase [Lederbergia sp. NSJ-179]